MRIRVSLEQKETVRGSLKVTAGPVTTHLRLNESSSAPTEWRNSGAFAITRVESSIGLPDRITKVSSAPGLLVSMSLRPLSGGTYRLWVGDKIVPTTSVPAFRVNVIDLVSKPSCWAGSAFDYVHYHVPRIALEEIAENLGFGRRGAFRLAIVEHDLVLAQMTKNILPYIGRHDELSPLAMDHFQLILGAHLLQRYGVGKNVRLNAGGLSAWQKKRAEALLREHLDGSVRLSELARECGLSVTHFARSFKASFGVSSHRWLLERRTELAMQLLIQTREPLVSVAIQSGFADQAAFTRTFHQIVGMSPGRWRREQVHP
jgi:AraC family transcriptional regulator